MLKAGDRHLARVAVPVSSHQKGALPSRHPRRLVPQKPVLLARDGEVQQGEGPKAPPSAYIPREVKSCPHCPLEEGKVLATRRGWEPLETGGGWTGVGIHQVPK